MEPEVLILGAGPGGATAALALSARGIPCRLIDQAVFPRDKVCGDALSGKVALTLRRIDPALISDLELQSFALGSHGVSFIAPNGRRLDIPFRKAPDPLHPPGFIAARMDFDNWLFRKASAAPGVSVHTGIRISRFKRTANGWEVSDKDGKQVFHARVVIAADGCLSRFAREHGGMQMEDEHHCAGLRAYYDGVEDLDPNGFIELHFVPEFLPGYFWIFPLSGGRANVGVGIRSDVARKRKINLREDMLKLIKSHPEFSRRFRNASILGQIQGCGLPLGSKRRPISGDGFMLVGDAGALIDPFTGEGIGNAMISGLKAAETIEACRGDYSARTLVQYDESVYRRLWPELSLSKRMQELVRYPWLFNLVVNKATRSQELRDTISCMFEDIDLRGKLSDPRFYLRVLLA
ncbi:MAG: NAD(P)/FAD-dependent oxidoreductase [Sphingobacteriales bacterium]|jgi:geranylgeranyl reductase family protein|nr:NAD(P)/FAD-dependent oxidoreductase [Sphingobacteriales bacterium]